MTDRLQFLIDSGIVEVGYTPTPEEQQRMVDAMEGARETIYANLRDTPVARTSETCIGRVFIDYDASNDPCGVEVIGCEVDELARLRADNEKLREALQSLYDHQNGCPLPSYERGWNEAMEAARAALEGK